MADSSMSLIVTSVWRDSANSPVNIALKYGEHAANITYGEYKEVSLKC